jgi:hypothetical protein
MCRISALTLAVVLLASCGGTALPTAPEPPRGTPNAAVNYPPGYPPVGSSLGAFELTFIANPDACSELPAEARSRTYAATLKQGNATSTLSGAPFLATPSPNLTWNVVYTRVTAEAAEVWFQDPPIWEALGDGYVVIYGAADGQLLDEASTLSAWGRFEYCTLRKPGPWPDCVVPATTCDSQSHQLRIQRVRGN